MNAANILFGLSVLMLIVTFVVSFHPRTRDLVGFAYYILLPITFALFYVGEAQATRDASLPEYLDRAAQMDIQRIMVVDDEPTMYKDNKVIEDKAPNIFGVIMGSKRLDLDEEGGISENVYRHPCKKPERVHGTKFEACESGGAAIFQAIDQDE